jgi:hypothetical protein
MLCFLATHCTTSKKKTARISCLIKIALTNVRIGKGTKTPEEQPETLAYHKASAALRTQLNCHSSASCEVTFHL